MTKYADMIFDKEGRPLCPNCLGNKLKIPMGKAGAGASGKRKCQSYRCNRCLTTWLNTKEPYERK